MIFAAILAATLVSEPVRLRGRVRYRVKRERVTQPPKPPVAVANPMCTEASPEYCGDEPPIVILRVRPDGVTFEDRWPDFLPTYKGDRLK